MNGTDASTVFKDSSLSTRTVTTVADAQMIKRKKAVLTIAIGPDYHRIGQLTHPILRKYAKKIDLPLDNVTFVVGKSQYTLPSVKERVDFALIDGDHMYPSPMIDFYYINQLMNVGGMFVIDDMQIPAVRSLYDFMIVSRYWKLISVMDDGRACAFQKTEDDKHDWWGNQEYNLKTLKKLKMVQITNL